jgi:hypothetical protein
MDISRYVTALQHDLASAAALGDEAPAEAGREPELVFVDEASGADDVPTPGDDLSARITLRLPETLKVSVEAAAGQEGVSTNAWIVRALSRALDRRSGGGRTGNRLQGFAQS